MGDEKQELAIYLNFPLSEIYSPDTIPSQRLEEATWREAFILRREAYICRLTAAEGACAPLWCCTGCGWRGDQAEDEPCPNCGGTDWSGVRRA